MTTQQYDPNETTGDATTAPPPERDESAEDIAATAFEAENTRGGESNLTALQLYGLNAGSIHADRVKTRTVDGRGQSYVEAWEIKAALIRLFGYGGWSGEVLESRILEVREDGRQGTKSDGSMKAPQVNAYALYRLTIFGIGPNGQDAVYTESSVGSNSGQDIGATMDNAIKTAASDALKRCAINLGTQFGLSLYANGSRGDVVRRVLEPNQRTLIEGERARRAEADKARIEGQLGRATGATS